MDDMISKLYMIIIAFIAAFLFRDKLVYLEHPGLVCLVLIGIIVFVLVIMNLVEKISEAPRKFRKSSYSAESFKGKTICNSKFSQNAVLEKNSNFFRNLSDKSLYGVYLPPGDYSVYDFCDVEIERTIFHIKSILPSDSELFQKIKDKSLEGTVLPEGDFRKYNFNDVDLYCTKFTKNSRLSDKNDFFQNVKNKVLSGVVLPSYEVRNFHLYRLNDVCIDSLFLEKNKLNSYQLLIAYNKNIDKNDFFEKNLF